MKRALLELRPPAMIRGFVIMAWLAAILPLTAAEWELTVTGEVKSPLNLSMESIRALPMSVAKETDETGKTVVYEGVSLHQILHQAGVPEGESLRGAALRLCILVKAKDGYTVLFSLAELDPMLGHKEVLLVIRSNGAELDAKSGPARLVIMDEKRHARWVRQVSEIEVIKVPSGETTH